MQNALQLGRMYFLTSTLTWVLSRFVFVECNIFSGSALISMLTVCCALAQRPALFNPQSTTKLHILDVSFNTETLIIWGWLHKLNLRLVVAQMGVKFRFTYLNSTKYLSVAPLKLSWTQPCTNWIMEKEWNKIVDQRVARVLSENDMKLI